MNTPNITYWLRKTPQPVAVMADDKRIDVPRNGRAWRDLTATIKSLEPSKLTALDGQGNVIRSITLESDEEKPAASPEMSDLQLFAKLLAEAWDKAGNRMQPVVDSAMAFVERGGQRLAKAEAENERLRQQIYKLNMQIADMNSEPPAPDADEGIVGAMVAGIMQGQATGGVPPAAASVSQIKGAKK